MFRYLCDHPLVCGSERKEAHFFDRQRNYDDATVRDAYLAHFPARTNEHRVCLEATPNYLDGGRSIARRIRSLLDDPYLLVMLRNPVDRMISYYKSKQGWTNSPVHNMSFSAFAKQALASRALEATELDPSGAELALQIRKSEYCKPLREFLSLFAAERVLVVFLDSLRDDPQGCLQSVCSFAGLPSEPYQQYDFQTENRSRFHRSAMLRTLSGKANLTLEPLLNRLPGSRQVLRRIYDLVNVTTSKSHSIDEDSIVTLEKHFAPYNRELRDLLRTQNPNLNLPNWLIR